MAATTEFAEIKASVLRSILVRRITLGVFSAVALVVFFVSRVSYLNPLFYSPIAWFLLTFPFKSLIERQDSLRSLHWVHTGFFFLEVLLITTLVHFMGGSAWIGNVFYLFTVIYANFLLPRLQGALVTGWVVACYSGLVLFEYGGLVPHRSLFGTVGTSYQSLEYVLATILAGAVGVNAVVAFTVRTFAAIYMQKTRMLSARELQLARMSRRLLTAQDEERRRIARELHDGLIQSLAAIKLHLAPVREQGGDAYPGVAMIVDEAIRQTRTLAYSIRPPLLDDLGLVPSLKRLAETVGRENDLAICVESDLEVRLDAALEGLLYYVVQEALQNAVRHARAHRVTVRLALKDRWVAMSVADDGIGFRPADREGLGLRGMRERIGLSGGVLSLESVPERGTTLSVEVPREED